MEMQQLLMSKASEAISALWFNQLEIISKSTGIEMNVLVNCLNMQVPEKKKRAPAKKKEPVANPEAEVAKSDTESDADKPVPEKKKRAPAKKKEPVAKPETEVAKPETDSDAKPETEVVKPEKKKRAPAKKKEPVAKPDTEDAKPETEGAKPDADAVPEKKKRAPAKKKEPVSADEEEEKKAKKEQEALEKKAKKEQSDKEALEKKAKKEQEALEKKVKKEQEALEKKAKKEQEALEKKAKEEVGDKKAKKVVSKKVVAVVAAPIARFEANEQVRYLRPNGKTVDVVIEYVIQNADYVEYRLQVVGKNETILSREESLFDLDEKPAYPDSSDDDDDADTVKMADTPETSPSKMDAEEVVINGTSYLIDSDNVAYLKSSNKMVGRYDADSHTIGQIEADEDSEAENSDEDEMPAYSDLSDTESD